MLLEGHSQEVRGKAAVELARLAEAGDSAAAEASHPPTPTLNPKFRAPTPRSHSSDRIIIHNFLRGLELMLQISLVVSLLSPLRPKP